MKALDPGTIIWAAELSAAETARALAGTVERTYAKGSYLCHRGDRLDYWTGVVTGLVKMSSVSRSGKAVTFAGIGSGGWFGEGSVLKNEARKYDLVTLRDTRLLLMNAATFRWLSENSIGFNRFLVRQLNERLAQFIASTEYERLLKPETRVARHLAWLCNPVLSPHVGNRIEITQEELALLAAVSRPIVGRSFQSLLQAELISVEHSAVIIRDLEGLAEFGS